MSGIGAFPRRIASRHLAALAVGALLVACYWFAPSEDWLRAKTAQLGSLGPIGAVLFLSMAVVMLLLMFPGFALALAAGAVFGMWGAPLMLLALTVASAAGLLISRHMAFDFVERAVAGRSRVQALRLAVESDWKLIFVLRFCPNLPFGLQSYLFGLTKVAFVPYLLATIAAITPATMLYVSFGAFGRAVVEGALGPAGTVLSGLALMAGVWAVFTLSRYVRKHCAVEGHLSELRLTDHPG
ncbi:MAG TPA: VTT domain-containing protein [Beijerinckiaceae bacterium]